MIKINGRVFVRNDSEMVDTLFRKEGTAFGYYKINKGGVILMDHQKEPFAFIVNNDKCSGNWFVSCSRREGRLLYMNALTNQDDVKLGFRDSLHAVSNFSYNEEHQIAKDAISQLSGAQVLI